MNAIYGGDATFVVDQGGWWPVGVDILPFLKDRSFDATATRVMGEAYDKARRMLHVKGQPHVVQELIAKRIIDIAANGERNADELAQQALQALGLDIVERL